MRKADRWLIVGIVIVSLLLYIPIYWKTRIIGDEELVVVVEYKGEEVLRVPLYADNIYEVDAKNGRVQIEVKDAKVRVEKEDSPYHICSKQGWVKDPNRPIVCLPNDLVVQIEADEEDEVDTVIY